MLPDDPRVVAGIRGRRHRGHQRVQIRAAADPGHLAPLGSSSATVIASTGSSAAVQLEDGLEDGLVGGSKEIARPEHLDYL